MLSKRQLYAAVLERVFAQPQRLADDVAAGLEGADAEEALRAAVGAYIDFLAEHPRYVRLLQRAALDDGDLLAEASAAAAAVTGALGAATGLADTGFRPVDPRHLVVSVIALCFSPLAHARTLVAPLGLDPDSAAFLAERKAHVVELLLRGLRAPRQQ